MSHATARPRQAGTSFESQAQQGAAGGSQEPAHRDLSTLRARLTAIPARPVTPTNNQAARRAFSWAALVAQGDASGQRSPGPSLGGPSATSLPEVAVARRPRYHSSLLH